MATSDSSAELVRTRWSSAREEDVFVVENPATGRPLARVQGSGEEEVDSAVRAARKGFESWRRRTPRERGAYLRQIAQVIRDNADELAALESSEVGKPFTQARFFDLMGCSTIFDLYGGLVESMPGRTRDAGYALDLTVLEPHGVVAAIVPFNWPPIHTAGKVAPALATGNAVVIKPGEQAPLVIMRIVELIASVLPDDVIHVVPGGPATGSALVGHELVRKVSFTGAPTTGRTVIKQAADHLTPTLMELGGKNALLVFEDADIDAAVRGAMEGGWFNQGESCTAASRLVVHRSVYAEFTAKLGKAVTRLRVGNGADRATHVGPLVTRVQQQRVLDYIEIGTREGATVAAQAALPDDPDLADGFFAPPTLFTDVRPDMRIAQEEIFGPVVVAIPFDTEDEALEIANGTEFGLMASVFTADQTRALRVARGFEAGMVMVNCYARPEPGMPFGGVKASGYGREHAVETLQEFGYSKIIRLPSGLAPLQSLWPAVDEVTS